MAETLIEKLDRFGRALDSRSRQLPRWVIPACLAASIAAAALLYLYPSPREFPMDDAYIHFVYAENLAAHAQLYFSFPDEKGVAASSFLWIALLAAGRLAGIPPHVAAKILGTLSLIVVSVGVYELLRRAWTPLRAAAAASLIAFSGNMLWFSLNGMETTLFLALGVLTLLSHRSERWGWFGVLAAALTLTRPEGLFLLAALALVEVIAYGRPRREFLLAASVGLLLAAPWYGYLKFRTGHFLPTSASAKQLGSALATDFVLKQYHLPQFIGKLSNLLYPAMWIAYLLEFALGGIALPPPEIRLAGAAGSPSVDISVWSFAAAAMVIWLAFLGWKNFFKPRQWNAWARDPNRRELLALFFWVVLHNLAYMILLPIPGTASRYGAVNYIVLWIGIAAGFSSLARLPARRWAAGLFLLVIAASNGLYWNRVYDANIEHMVNARVPAAHYVRDFRADDLCAAFDVGSLRYYSGRPIVEMAALLEPDGADKFVNGGADKYLVERGATCLVLPGRAGRQSEGMLDFASIMGLTSSPLFEMELVKVFEIDHNRWLLGYLPTVNYQASVAIYRLKMK